MWKNLLLIPLSLVLGFILLEAAARFWFALPDPYPIRPGLLVLDSRGFWIPEPNYRGQADNRIDFRAKKITITKYGTRLVPCAPAEDKAGNRIFLVGDSQTFGFGLADKETWANLLQCRLNDWRGARSTIHNLGVPAINIDQYYRRTSRALSNILRPGDLVIVSVTWNDLHTWQRTDYARIAVRESQVLEPTGAPPPGSEDLAPVLVESPQRLNSHSQKF